MTDEELSVAAQGQGSDARYARRVQKRRAAAVARGGSDDFTSPLTEALEDLASRIDPSARKRMAGAIATDLRTANARRLRANVQPPDDDPMAPRKPQEDRRTGKGRLRSKKLRDPLTRTRKTERSELMFRRASSSRYLRKESSTGEAAVGFVGAMARIMRVHQYGGVDHVTRKATSPLAHYPARTVLGMDAADRQRVLERVTAQVAP